MHDAQWNFPFVYTYSCEDSSGIAPDSLLSLSQTPDSSSYEVPEFRLQ